MFKLFDKVKICYQQLLLKENEPPIVPTRFYQKCIRVENLRIFTAINRPMITIKIK